MKLKEAAGVSLTRATSSSGLVSTTWPIRSPPVNLGVVDIFRGQKLMVSHGQPFFSSVIANFDPTCGCGGGWLRSWAWYLKSTFDPASWRQSRSSEVVCGIMYCRTKGGCLGWLNDPRAGKTPHAFEEGDILVVIECCSASHGTG